MPELNGPDKEAEDKRQFIKEKIVRQPLTGRQIARQAALVCGSAAVFGVIAAAVFALTSPYFRSFLGNGNGTESTAVSIPRDETSASAAEEASQADQQEEPIQQQVEDAVSSYRFTMEDFSRMVAPVKEIAQKADKGIVTVHSVRHETDWFNNPVENTGFFAGALIAETPTEVLILTTEEAVEAADAIRVTFYDGTEAAGTKKQTDQVSGMSVVSVSRTDISEDTEAKMEILTLGNSYQMKMGDVVMAVGSPLGVVHSLDYGTLGYVAKSVPVTDGSIRVLYADIKGNAPMGTFLINTAGEIVGWVEEQYKSEAMQDVTAAAGISDYKGIIEKMSNGRGAAYLGIQGQDITAEMEKQGLPSGVYIVEVTSGSPAYQAGIQNGDILKRIGSGEVSTVKELQTRIENMEPGAAVVITVMRKGIDEYKELEYEVTVGAR